MFARGKKKKKKKKKKGEPVGLQAIEAALARAYPGEPLQVEPGPSAPLVRIEAHRAEKPSPHWVYVGFGLSELDGKEADDVYAPAGGVERDRTRSGWGCEFTCRVAATEDDHEPPQWPLRLLMILAGYVQETRNPFAAHHTMDLESSLDPGEPDALVTAIALVPDPVLGSLETPNGRVDFLQVVGVTLDELDAGREWDLEKMLGVLQERLPLGITHVRRASVLADAATRKRVEEGIARDGSSQLICYLECRWWRAEDGAVVRLDLPRAAVSRFRRLLRGRTLFGREFRLYAEEQGVLIQPGERPGFTEPVPAVLQITLDAALAKQIETELDETKDEAQCWERLPGFLIRVVPDDEAS